MSVPFPSTSNEPRGCLKVTLDTDRKLIVDTDDATNFFVSGYTFFLEVRRVKDPDTDPEDLPTLSGTGSPGEGP